MNQWFTHNKSSLGRSRGASKTSKNSTLCEPRGTFTAHGFEEIAKPFVQVFNIRFVCCPSFVCADGNHYHQRFIDFSGRGWASFRSLESCRAEASGRFPTPISLGRSSLPPACLSGVFTSCGTCLNVNPSRFGKGNLSVTARMQPTPRFAMDQFEPRAFSQAGSAAERYSHLPKRGGLIAPSSEKSCARKTGLLPSVLVA